MIPLTFEEWKNCIVNDCGINLTKEFAQSRLKVYTDEGNAETVKFKKLYGKVHLERIIHWLETI